MSESDNVSYCCFILLFSFLRGDESFSLVDVHESIDPRVNECQGLGRLAPPGHL